MNRIGLVVGFVLAALLLTPTAAQAKPITEVQRGTVCITVTPYPSKFGSLSAIAKAFYGNPALWPKIQQANRISNPNLIRVGQRVCVHNAGNSHNLTPPPRRSVTAKWVHPLSVRVSSCYGRRWGRVHQGIDYDGNQGDPIRAVGAGKVKRVGWWAGGYGISVLIYHGGNTYTHYAHMSKSATRVNRTVKAGQVIGYVGATGHATGAHLHFEVWRGMWGQIDPRPWLRAHGLRPGC